MDTTKVHPPIVLSRIGQRFARVYVDLGIRQKMVLSAALGSAWTACGSRCSVFSGT
jgi:hypothetical protein